MSHDVAGPYPAGIPTLSAPHEDQRSAKHGGDQISLAIEPNPTRQVTPARVGPSRHFHSRPYYDPCNYLG